MVNLIDVVISNSDGGDWREMGSCRGLRPEAAVSASLWLPGEGLALLWMLQVLGPGFRVKSMKLSRPLTLFVLHTSLDRMGTGVVNSLLQMDTLRPNSPQNPYDVVRARWNKKGGPGDCPGSALEWWVRGLF